MKDTDRLKRLTRRGFLVLGAGGAAGFAYLQAEGRPGPEAEARPGPEAEGRPGPEAEGRPEPQESRAGQIVPVAGGFVPIAVKPSRVLDLAAWKLNLPTDNQQVTQPALNGFHDDAFKVTEAVQFTVTCGGEPEPGSKFPRSELREMNADGSNASWSTTSGIHRMDLTQRVTHLPVIQPKLVCGQIHSVTAYLILVVLDGRRLYVKYKDAVAGVLDENYQLGTYFDMTIRAAQGYVDVFYNGAHLVHQAMAETGCYFKAGCYLQSNTSLGDLPAAYGQVEITSLAVSHRPAFQ